MNPLATEHLNGHADDRIADAVARLDAALAGDPELSFQAAAFHRGVPVLDVWGGHHLGGDSVLVPFSVTKNTIGVTIGLLVERGLLDLDDLVADHWPEFAAAGKQRVTVRQLLSHQAGLAQTDPPLDRFEALDQPIAAARLAATRPLWHPGSAFGYHGVTIGNLGAELIHRVTGRTMHAFYEEEIRAPHDIDFFLGLPAGEEHRRVDLRPMTPPAAGVGDRRPTALGVRVFGSAPPTPDFANDPRSWRYGHPATSGTGSARGIARLLAAAVTGVEGAAPFLSADTVAQIGQQQVHGYDEVLGQHDRAHAIVFQKPTAAMPFGGVNAFGHDGAAGGLACVDPETGIAFAWTIARGAWPGGGDPRAIALAAELGRLFAD
ncbi:beta-lactamase class C and other penicillin binding proteins [Microbacterium testaceum StLB037]|uniref:Beta-lactamase class C and other penicillin binding proteins n=1 Tax=Microbacterium testaceum (strain StLB037) TaxID=979556 RepID=E8NDE0_MICTS|nr:serine hydrolase domain-containing protein [Microbacterium testaceum]BAJ74998.1 beta-lactamase class C and other penicillin binding proteins [Microbacterium testaceum StLB037]